MPKQNILTLPVVSNVEIVVFCINLEQLDRCYLAYPFRQGPIESIGVARCLQLWLFGSTGGKK